MAGNKYLSNNAGTITEVHGTQVSAGGANANQIPALNASGVFDTSLLPTGIGADTAQIVASEALSAGAFVNVWNNSSAFNVRNADGSTSGKEAHGFVLAAVSSSGTATVYFAGTNNAVTGVTAGVQYLSSSAVGGFSSTAPSGSGQTVQRLGVGTTSTAIDFNRQTPIVLA
jgi:hypothetical protein